MFFSFQAAEVSKPAPKRSTISLFDDEDDEDEDDGDIFSITPSAKVFSFFLGRCILISSPHLVKCY